MRILDALISFLGRAVIVFLSGTALVSLATVLVVFFLRDAACKRVAVDPVPPSASSTVPHLSDLAAIKNYVRGEQISPLTYPEWYIVYSAREYAHFLGQRNTPTNFPFGYATAQYWCSYSALTRYAERNFPPDTGSLVVLMTIGASFSAENIIQSAYEQSFGRVSGWNGTDTPEDRIQREESQKYAAFLDTTPWYEYPFFSAVKRLWNEPPFVGPQMLRKWERKVALSIGYGAKGVYGFLIGKATRAAYAPADLTIFLLVRGPLSDVLISDPDIKVHKDFGDGTLILEVPRYQEFTRIMLAFAHENVEIVDVSAAKSIVISAIAPNAWDYNLPGIMLFSQPLVVDKEHSRIVASVPVPELSEAIRAIAREGLVLEHVYDF